MRVVFVVDVTYQHNWYGLLREMGQGLEPEPLTRKRPIDQEMTH